MAQQEDSSDRLLSPCSKPLKGILNRVRVVSHSDEGPIALNRLCRGHAVAIGFKVGVFGAQWSGESNHDIERTFTSPGKGDPENGVIEFQEGERICSIKAEPSFVQ